jgi:peptidoglycan-associated lipoprotein
MCREYKAISRCRNGGVDTATSGLHRASGFARTIRGNRSTAPANQRNRESTMKRLSTKVLKRSAGLRLALATALVVGLSGCASTPEEEPEDAGTGSEFSDAAATTPDRETADDTKASRAAVMIAPVYFDFDRSDIRANAKGALRDAARELKKSGGKVVISGHCDNRGSEEYNLALGERRAAAVRRDLANRGVPMRQMTIVSYGEIRPAARGNTESAWSLNRRAEFKVSN